MGLIISFNSPSWAAAPDQDSLVMGKLVRDYKTIRNLTLAEDQLFAEMDGICRKSLTVNLYSIQDEEQIANWMFAYTNVLKAFQKIAWQLNQISVERKLTEKQKEKVLNVSFGALVEWYRMICYLSLKPAKIRILFRKLNESVPEFGIPEWEFNKLVGILGNMDLREKVSLGFHDIWRVFEKENTTDRPFQKRLKESYDFIFANAPDPLKSKIKHWLKTSGSWIYKQYYRTNIAISTWIGDTKYRPRKPSINYDRVREMTAKLRPGDFLLERENWFLSNLFLPGFWKHGILYVGTIDDIKRLGLDKNPIVAKYLAEYSRPDENGHTKRVLEAISEGVVMNPMEEATDADYICAFRPRLTDEQIKNAIITGFSHLGKPYDFQFDFQTSDKIVCTELLYRAYKESLRFNLNRMMGRWAVSADDILRKFISERNSDSKDFDFIFFLDSDLKTQKTAFKDENALCESIKRPSANLFLSEEEAPK